MSPFTAKDAEDWRGRGTCPSSYAPGMLLSVSSSPSTPEAGPWDYHLQFMDKENEVQTFYAVTDVLVGQGTRAG